MKKHFFFLVTTLAFYLISCKDQIDNISHKTLPVDVPIHLKTIKWPSLGRTATFEYNIENNVSKISYTGGTPHVRNFTYAANGITQVSSPQSLSGNVFEYDQQKRMAKMNRTITDSTIPRVYQSLEFFYKKNDKIQKIDFYSVNSNGKTLNSTWSYTYDQNSLVSRIEITEQGGVKRFVTIEAYSDVFYFDPIYFLDIEIGQLTSICNYPVLNELARIGKMPKKIKTSIWENGQEKLTNQIDMIYTTVNGKIIKQINTSLDVQTLQTNTLDILYEY